MKRILIAFTLLLTLSGVGYAQSTTVSGQVTDAGGQTWNNGTVVASFVPIGTQNVPYKWTGGAFGIAQQTVSGTLNGTGAYSISVPSNSAITPSGTKWLIVVYSNTTPQFSASTTVTVTGATQTVNFTPSAVSVSASSGTAAYADAEVSASVGQTYYNLTTSILKVCTAATGSTCTAWASAGGFSSPMTTLGDLIAEDATPTPVRLPGPTTPNGVPQILTDTPSGGAAALEAWALPGVPTNAQTGTTYTIAVTDRASYVTFSNGSAIAVTLPSAASSGFGSNFVFVACDIGTGTATITPTTSTISYSTGSAYTSAASSMALTTGQCAWIYSDNTNYFAIQRTGGAPIYPVTVSGTVNSGGIPYFNSTTQESSSAILNTNKLIKGGGAGGAPTNSSISDDGTTVSTAEPVAVGASPPACLGGTSGGMCFNEGTDLINVAGAAGIDANSTQHEFVAFTNGVTGASNQGLLVRTQPGRIHSIGNTAAITTATLCASAAGACNTAGLYTVDWAFTQGGTACGTPGTGGVTFLLTWTDANALAHSAISLAMDDSASLVATTGTFNFRTTNAAAWASGTFNIYTNGSIIQYATGYTACGVGTGTYNLDITVTRKGQT